MKKKINEFNKKPNSLRFQLHRFSFWYDNLVRNTKIKLLLALLAYLAINLFLTYKQEYGSQNIPPNQIEKLDQVSKDLESLQIYVKDQKKNLIDQQQVLRQLKEEKAEIEPLLNANKEVVDALFLRQSKNQRDSIWKERVYGFVFGMIASLLASILYDLFKLKYVQRKVADPANND